MVEEYQAGESNIGEEEIKYRKRIVGYGSAIVAVTLYIMLVFFNVPLVMYTIMLVPVFISVHGFSEARHQFCTSYARAGKYNMRNELGMTQDVISQDKRNKDKRFANKLVVNSLQLTILITAVLVAMSRFFR